MVAKRHDFSVRMYYPVDNRYKESSRGFLIFLLVATVFFKNFIVFISRKLGWVKKSGKNVNIRNIVPAEVV